LVAAFDDVLGLATEAATTASPSDKLGDLDLELLALSGYEVAGGIQPPGVNFSICWISAKVREQS
jgi:hypothetical protein